METRPETQSATGPDYAVLVLRAQQGNQAALAVLYESFFDRIYRYVLARIGDVPEAEDITEEVFFRMLRSLSGFRPQTGECLGFSSWLFQIAHNLVVDRLRRQTCHEAGLNLLRNSMVGLDTVAGPDQGWDKGELGLAVERLSSAQRDVITLRFAAGLSLVETAAVLGKQLGNVKVLQHNALANLRRILEDETPRSAAPSTPVLSLA